MRSLFEIRTLRVGAIKYLILAGCFAFGANAFAQDQQPTEYQVKAAFLYNFAKFISWPEDSFANGKAPFVFGILGKDPFDEVLDRILQEKNLHGRPVEVKRFKKLEDVVGCHILFISSSEKKRLPLITQALKGVSVLTVGEYEEFTLEGGMINFILENSRVCFEINPDFAAQARLQVSSKLLALAKIVKSGTRN